MYGNICQIRSKSKLNTSQEKKHDYFTSNPFLGSDRTQVNSKFKNSNLCLFSLQFSLQKVMPRQWLSSNINHNVFHIFYSVINC